MPKKAEKITYEMIDSLNDQEIKKKYKNLRDNARYLFKIGYNANDREIIERTAMMVYIKEKLRLRGSIS